MVHVLCLKPRGWCLIVRMAGSEVAITNSRSSVQATTASGFSVDLLHKRSTSRSGHVNRLQLPSLGVHGLRSRDQEGYGYLWERDLVGDALALDLIIALHVCHLDVGRLAQVLRQSRSSTCFLALHLSGASLVLMRSNACHSAQFQIRDIPGTGCRASPQVAIAAFEKNLSGLRIGAFGARAPRVPSPWDSAIHAC